MAEKQDQMEEKMNFSQMNLFGNTSDPQSESEPKYFHTLIVTDSTGESHEWQSSQQVKIKSIPAYQTFSMGGGSFSGIFDSVRIWNRALSTGDAKKLGMPDNKAGLISHWRMAEGKGAIPVLS